jgi:hypothetical protein
VVESQPSKLLVAGSIPVSRSSLRQTLTAFATTAGKPLNEATENWLTADLSAEAASAASVLRRPM